MLAQLFNRSTMAIETMAQGFQQKASHLGLPFGPWRKIFNTRLAQEVGLWAEEQGKGDLFHIAAFKAYLVDEQNIALKDVLLKLVEAVGLSSTKANDIIEKRVFKDAVDKDWDLSRRMRIYAIPTLMLRGMRLGGAKPYEQIVHFVKSVSEAYDTHVPR